MGEREMTPERAEEIAVRIRADYALSRGAGEAIKQAILQACAEQLAEAKRKRDKHFAAKALKHDIARHVEFATELWEQLKAQNRSLKLADAAFDALEARAAAMKEALSQILDDMGEDGYCVCPAAKIQAIAAIRGAE